MPPAIDEFEDLTQFADESFDNDEVDLFEFTDDDESPLLRLKSIVLSLDWDITEDTLAELTEELSDLRSLWDGDKVAQIYLQGMDNIGKYLQKEGAYAHPNAIKLLLTLFYNYEKIISSTDLSSEAIAVMLKADVRKFKVLQYQIGTAGVEGHAEKHAEEHVEEHVEAVSPPEKIIQGDIESTPLLHEEADDPLTSMEATILGLEWEVTQEGLEKFHSEATELRGHLADNRDAQILVQGLQALGSYIREEKSNAHPDSFTILHAFYDALKVLIQDKNLTAEQRKRVLIEQIGSLNSLKAIIAKSAADRAADKSAEEQETRTEEAVTAEIPVPGQGTEDKPELGTVSDDDAEFDSPVADDDADLDLFSEDFDESSDFSVGGDDVDEFFLDGDDSLSDDSLVDEESIAGDFGFDVEGGFDDDLFAEETKEGEEGSVLGDDAPEEESILPALTDADEDGGFNEELVVDGIDNEKTAELDEKLDSFFDFDDLDETKGHKEEAVTVEESASPADEQPKAKGEESDGELVESDVELDSFFDFSDDVVAGDESLKEEEKARAESWKDEILAADFDGPDGEEEGLLEGEEDYDSFFDFDSDEDGSEILPDEQVAATDNDNTLAESDDEFKISLDGLDDEQDSEEMIVALADADEERGFNEDEMSSGIADEKAAELDEKLNFFFELDKEEQEDSPGDQILGAEDEDAVTTGALAESDAFDEKQGEVSLELLELDEDSSELSFDEEKDFDGDIAGFSDIDDTEVVSAAVDQGDESASDSEEEIEGLDAIFDFGDDGEEAVPDFDKSSAGGTEEIPALDDEFVVSLDDEEGSADELFDFSFDSDDDEEGAVVSESSADLDSADSFFGFDEESEGKVEVTEVSDAGDAEDEFTLSLDDEGTEGDEFALSLDKEDTGADELSEFFFDSDDDEEGAVVSESSADLDSTDSFFGLDEESEGEVEVAEVTDADDAEDEFALSLDDEGTEGDEFALSLDEEDTGADELSEFSFGSDDADESAVVAEPSEALDSEVSTDSFFGFDEESEGEVEVAEVTDADDAEDEFALSLDDEGTEGDEFALSLDEEDTGADELSEFSFGSDDADESAVVAEPSEALDSEVSTDSFFGLDEESEGEVEVAEVTDADDAEDEFALSLDDEGTEGDEFALSLDEEDTGADELSEFSFDSDDADESAVVAEPSEALDSEISTDSFFGLDEESEGEVEVAEVTDADDAEDEFALSLDDEGTEGDEFALSLDEEDTGADELSEFSFDSDDADESAVVAEPSEALDSEVSTDSFFGLDEESEGEVEVAEVTDADDAEDEFALSLDDEEHRR